MKLFEFETSSLHAPVSVQCSIVQSKKYKSPRPQSPELKAPEPRAVSCKLQATKIKNELEPSGSGRQAVCGVSSRAKFSIKPQPDYQITIFGGRAGTQDFAMRGKRTVSNIDRVIHRSDSRRFMVNCSSVGVPAALAPLKWSHLDSKYTMLILRGTNKGQYRSK